MSVKKSLMPYLAQCLSSDTRLKLQRQCYELKRRLLCQPHQLRIFIKIDDPYSYILLQALQRFCPVPPATPAFQLSIFPISSTEMEAFPEPELWQQYAFKDCIYLGKLYQFNFPKDNATADTAALAATQALLTLCSNKPDLQQLITVFEQFWRGEFNNINTVISDGDSQALARNSRLLNNLGHYQAATINYAGEWYWGVDRLAYLEQRLSLLECQKSNISFTKTRLKLPAATLAPTTNNEARLTLYFSIRSPYSHLGLEQAVLLANKYQIPLIIKPVLPMVMRGLAVPQAKKMYIFYDTVREARRLNIAYGKVADPLGKGVENCYALFEYAKQQGKAVDYLLNYSRAVNSRGVHSDSDEGLKLIVEQSGLNWQYAKSLLTQSSWQQWAQQNLDEMLTLGLWGVPSFNYQDDKQQVCMWGQDRLARVEQLLSNHELS